ncbi:hypothetical protein BDW22DRAFT_1431869 [Trametopsis cervina]|nr:hypothetical protein BDW22DRAFT_1431869 [Trametopsis cervina]
MFIPAKYEWQRLSRCGRYLEVCRPQDINDEGDEVGAHTVRSFPSLPSVATPRALVHSYRSQCAFNSRTPPHLTSPPIIMPRAHSAEAEASSSRTDCARPATVHIRRPKNAFFYFRMAYRERTDILRETDISTAAGKEWQALPPDDQKPFRILAAKEKEMYAEVYPDYKFRPQRKKANVKGGKARGKGREKASVVLSLSPASPASLALLPLLPPPSPRPPTTPPAGLGVYNHPHTPILPPVAHRQPPGPMSTETTRPKARSRRKEEASATAALPIPSVSSARDIFPSPPPPPCTPAYSTPHPYYQRPPEIIDLPPEFYCILPLPMLLEGAQQLIAHCDQILARPLPDIPCSVEPWY